MSLDAELIKWQEQKEQRVAYGDKLDQPRDVDHFVYFNNKKNAQASAEILEAAGYRVATRRKGLTGALVEASRADTLTDENVKKFLTEILSIVEPLDGNYDGFGASVED